MKSTLGVQTKGYWYCMQTHGVVCDQKLRDALREAEGGFQTWFGGLLIISTL